MAIRLNQTCRLDLQIGENQFLRRGSMHVKLHHMLLICTRRKIYTEVSTVRFWNQVAWADQSNTCCHDAVIRYTAYCALLQIRDVVTIIANHEEVRVPLWPDPSRQTQELW